MNHDAVVKYQNQLNQATSTFATNEIGRLRSAPARLLDVVRAWQVALVRVEDDYRSSEAAKVEDRNEVKQRAYTAIDKIEAQAKSDFIAMRAKLAPAAPANDTEKLAREMAHARLWDRAKRQLDAGVDIQTVINRADRETVDVIDEEIESYLWAQYPKDIFGPATAQIRAAKAMIGQRRAAVYPPEDLRRLERLSELEIGEVNIQTALNYVRHHIATDERSALVITDWPKGATLKLEERQKSGGRII